MTKMKVENELNGGRGLLGARGDLYTIIIFDN